MENCWRIDAETIMKEDADGTGFNCVDCQYVLQQRAWHIVIETSRF